MNKMPEVAKMLGVEIGEKFKTDRESVNDWFEITEDGVLGQNGIRYDNILNNALRGTTIIRPLPRYTIPSDLEVDAKVWVRMKETEEWRPYHFVEIGICNYRPYTTHIHGYTSHSNSCNEFCHWAFCITDEEYRKRKEGE